MTDSPLSPGPDRPGFTYAAVGATRDAARTMPDSGPREGWTNNWREGPWGFRTLRVSTRIGRGGAVFAAASEALMEWRMHREMGVVVDTAVARAVTGAEVTVGLGVGRARVHAPCRVVWTVEEERRTGWAYGTLPGHPVSGEEAFLVDRENDGTVRLTVLAFSRPDVGWTRAAGPLLRLFQYGYARRCGRFLTRIARRAQQARE